MATIKRLQVRAPRRSARERKLEAEVVLQKVSEQEAQAERVASESKRLEDKVRELRGARIIWGDIADGLGCSRQTAYNRYRHVDAQLATHTDT